MSVVNFFYRIYNKLFSVILIALGQYVAKIYFYFNDIKLNQGFNSTGIPIILIHRLGEMKIGTSFKINNTIQANPIGRDYKCLFVIRENAILEIGDNVGMSGTTIVCQHSIVIGDYVKIGGNVCIYDTDFHALDALIRANNTEDQKSAVRKKVQIGHNVFIGAHTTILKGVTIGNNSIIGACSVITKSIPDNEIWAGNPAKFIKKVHTND